MQERYTSVGIYQILYQLWIPPTSRMERGSGSPQGAILGHSEMLSWVEPLPTQDLPCPVHWCFSSKPDILATEYKPKSTMRNLLSKEHNSLDSCSISIQGVLGTGKRRENLPHHFHKHSKPNLATHTQAGNSVQRNMGRSARAEIWYGMWVCTNEWSRGCGSQTLTSYLTTLGRMRYILQAQPRTEE